MTTKTTFSSARKFDLNTLKTKMKESAAGKKSFGNDQYWNLSRDRSGNGEATLRFLPGRVEDTHDMPFVKIFSHSFQGPSGQWLIENCPTTLGNECPICEANRVLYNGTEDDKKVAGTRKRKTSYVSNVLVVSDPANPDNEGKVFLFRYGKKIFDMLIAASSPEDEDEVAVDPFALDGTGANFRLKASEVAGFPNYDKSKFSKLAAVDLNQEQLDKVLESQHSLGELISPDKFKSYHDLKAKFEKTIGGTSAPSTVGQTVAAKQPKAETTVEDTDETPPWENKVTESVGTKDPTLEDLEKLLED